MVEFCIHECGLHQCLAIVEHTIHLHGCDVLTQRRELAFLNRADLALRIKDIDVDAFHTEETVCHGRTRVARSGNQHVHQVGLSFFLDEILQEASHEAGTNILECQCWTVEEFERIDVVLHLLHWAVEGERVEDDAL